MAWVLSELGTQTIPYAMSDRSFKRWATHKPDKQVSEEEFNGPLAGPMRGWTLRYVLEYPTCEYLGFLARRTSAA
jgi:hypothetical protein